MKKVLTILLSVISILIGSFLAYSWIGSNFHIAITAITGHQSPNNAVVSNEFTIFGYAYDTLNNMTHVKTQYYEDVNQNGAIDDAAEGSGTDYYIYYPSTESNELSDTYLLNIPLLSGGNMGQVSVLAEQQDVDTPSNLYIRLKINDTWQEWQSVQPKLSATLGNPDWVSTPNFSGQPTQVQIKFQSDLANECRVYTLVVKIWPGGEIFLQQNYYPSGDVNVTWSRSGLDANYKCINNQTGSFWTTIYDLKDFAVPDTGQLAPHYVCSSDIFEAGKKYWIRVVGYNSAGEVSADPNVENILSGDGNWSNETDCYFYFTVADTGLIHGTRPRW